MATNLSSLMGIEIDAVLDHLLIDGVGDRLTIMFDDRGIEQRRIPVFQRAILGGLLFSCRLFRDAGSR